VLYFSVAPEVGSKVLRVSVARGASGAGVRVVVDGSLGVVGEAFVFRALAFEGSVGGVMVYFDVMRVCDELLARFGAGVDNGWEGEGKIRTVEGRALRRRVDCVSHDWAVSRYGIFLICADTARGNGGGSEGTRACDRCCGGS
jgi:hypothetical protein